MLDVVTDLDIQPRDLYVPDLACDCAFSWASAMKMLFRLPSWYAGLSYVFLCALVHTPLGRSNHNQSCVSLCLIREWQKILHHA